MSGPDRFRTGIGDSDADHIHVLGHDITELLGTTSFGELAYWLVTKRRPTPGEAALFEAVLVALADHGFTPTAISARLTLLSAPEALQGAIAAGLLGGGSRFLGVTEDCAAFLASVIAELDMPDGGTGSDEPQWDDVARTAVAAAKQDKRLIPGLGHPVHKRGDPRTAVLFRLAREHGTFGPHLALLEAIGRVHPDVIGRQLPINGAGVCGAVLADIGIPVGVTRGVALLARCAGLLGHLAEELTDPIANDIYLGVDRNIDYRPPT